MYTSEQLSRYPYFEHILKEKRISDILDTLTGLVSRAYITAFMQSLMDEGTPFSFGFIDLDNFKFINDTYGHPVGDGVLASVAKDLHAFLGDFGVAGRFGGDEMIVVNLRDRTYADKKQFCVGMFQDRQVFRKTAQLPEYEPFITATMGMASFPEDAQDYDSLFTLIDKLLYRGKSKGRNCYIIYMEEKHKNLELKTLKSHSLFSLMSLITQTFDQHTLLDRKMHATFEAMKDDMRLTNLFYINHDRELVSIADGQKSGAMPDIDALVTDGIMYTTNALSELQPICPVSYELLQSMEIETLLLMRIGIHDQTYGYLLCAEPHNLRIWQDDEFALMFSFARLIASELLARDQVLL